MIKKTRKITVYAKELETKTGRKFLVYSTKVDDKYYEVKFSQKCVKKPMTQGYFDVTIDQYFVKPNGEYNDIIWVCACSHIEAPELPDETDPLANTPIYF